MSAKEVKGLFDRLFTLSESRGKESSGLAAKYSNEIRVLKSPSSATELIKSKKYREIFSEFNEKDISSFQAIGHSRLVTNGMGALNINNQPVIMNDEVLVHNGIVVNHSAIWESLAEKAKTGLDTEALLALFVEQSAIYPERISALKNTFRKIEGNASICIINSREDDLLLATDNGSLYYIGLPRKGLFMFASEKFILKQMLGAGINAVEEDITHLSAGFGLVVSQETLNAKKFSLESSTQIDDKNSPRVNVFPIFTPSIIRDFSGVDYPDLKSLRRCAQCILPSTFPGLVFDKNGVCNKCHEHQGIKLGSVESLKRKLKPFRSVDGSPDCIVGSSGGRDSCYGLHIIKEELGFNPIAYTYDWGLVTDLARRNVSRICGKLGVEHILVSADIHKKRGNVRRNIEAWLKKPDLSMIPLFMAGDKQFYYYAHQLRKQTGIDLFLFAAGNALERTDFKIAFSGLKGDSGKGVLTQLSGWNKLKLLLSYGGKFLANPRYINRSLIDSFHAFYSSYFLKDDYFYLYHYYPWSEEDVNKTLIENYGWETSPDTTTTWRIGDGTAAFYNYIYYVVAGFTEHDTFRSNQIREGMISREKGMCLVEQDNQPRWESLKWYANTVGFNLDEALLAIHRMPKLY